MLDMEEEDTIKDMETDMVMATIMDTTITIMDTIITTTVTTITTMVTMGRLVYICDTFLKIFNIVTF